MNSYIVAFGLLVLCAVLLTADEKQQKDVNDLLASLSDDAKLEILNEFAEFEDHRESEDPLDDERIQKDAKPLFGDCYTGNCLTNYGKKDERNL